MLKQLLIILLLFCAPAYSAQNSDVILVLGDSLSASYGINTHQGWVTLLQQRLQQKHYPYRVVNASISGDTTRGGLERLPRSLAQHKPAIVIIELGGNDGLRGLALSQMQQNLSAMILACRQQGDQVLLVGVRLPPNYGTTYIQKFHQIYRDVAQEHRIRLVPYLLKDIGGHEQLMQTDGIHPRQEAQQRMLDNVWQELRHLLSAKLKR